MNKYGVNAEKKCSRAMHVWIKRIKLYAPLTNWQREILYAKREHFTYCSTNSVVQHNLHDSSWRIHTTMRPVRSTDDLM